MSTSAQHHAINYIEFTTSDIAQTKSFYQKVFGWSFQDWGPDYISFDKVSAGIDGGFRRGESAANTVDKAAPLIVFYSRDLRRSEAAILNAGGKVVVPTFDFPGGKRFHFADGTGNVLAVWSE